jgi:hypothetical protein
VPCLWTNGIVSGLIDVLEFAEVADGATSLENVLAGKDTWISFNVTSAVFPEHVEVAVKAGVKRAVFAVRVSPDEQGENTNYDDITARLRDAGVAYTIIKFADFVPLAEAKYPYRIVRGNKALPTEGRSLSSHDLFRVRILCAVCIYALVERACC